MMTTDPAAEEFDRARKRDRYQAYVAGQQALALVAVWPACETCHAGTTRPCKAWCPTIAHVFRERPADSCPHTLTDADQPDYPVIARCADDAGHTGDHYGDGRTWHHPEP